MAGFGDANDIKISVTLDTKSAVESVEELKTSIKQTLEITKSQFLRIAEISKSLNKVAVENIKSRERIELERLKNEDAANQRSFSAKIAQIAAVGKNTQQQINASLQAFLSANAAEVKTARTGTTERIATARIESRERIKLFNDQLKAAKDTAKNELDIFKEKENTKRIEIKKTIAEIEQETVRIRKTRIPKAAPVRTLPSGPAVGSGKDVGLLGQLNGLLETYNKQLTSAASALFLLRGGFSGVIGTVSAFANSVAQLSNEAARLEGLAAGFETLQRSIGRLPTESIELLRRATQGLVSDTELYQKANQAVLLGVPTKLFEESAEAAVKLGRAMGIDAAFALESLSIGLGRQSRLYLDNLGIVVSATEAYRNFASQNNKLVSDLTESDKRLAFFNETSKQLKESLATLPPVQDTVGTKFRELTTTFGNLQAKFLSGFNENKNLADSYSGLNDSIKTLEQAFKDLGDVYASVISFIINNPLSKNIIGAASAAIGAVSKGLKDELGAGSDFESRLKEANKGYQEAQRGLDEFLKGRSSKLSEALGFDEEYYRKTVEAARLNVENIKKEQENLSNLPPAKIRVDVEEIQNAAANYQAAIAQVKERIGEEQDIVQIRGVDQSLVDQAIQQIAAIGEGLERGKTKAAEAQASIQGVFDTLAQAAQTTQLAKVAEDIAKLDKTSKDYEKTLAQLQAEQKELQVALAPEAKTLERINKVVEVGLKLSKERVKSSKGVQKEVNKEQRELDSFIKTLNRATRTAIPKQIQQDLVKVFQNATLSTEQFKGEIIKLFEQLRKGGGDVDAFADEVKALQDLLDEGLDRTKITIDADTTKAKQELDKTTEDFNNELRNFQSNLPNFRDLIFGEEFDPTGKKIGGGFFGFDIDGIGKENEAAIASSLQDAAQLGLGLAFEKVTREDAPQLAQQVGATLGTVIGAIYGDPATGGQIGGFIGQIVGQIIAATGGDAPGAKEKKSIDKYFAELFDGKRLGVVIEGQIQIASGFLKNPIADQLTQSIATEISNIDGVVTAVIKPTLVRISDLVFTGLTTFAGNVRFGVEDVGNGFNAFSSFFKTLPTEVQASFNGIGLAFGQLLGVAEEQAKLIGVALANNIGGSLQNLQVLIQATGESLETLADSVIQAFLDSKITIEDAYNSLAQLQKLYEKGIPGAVGAYEEAIKNLNDVLESNRPGRYAIDSLRDIAVEGIEAGKSFDFVVGKLGATFGFTAQQQQRLFEALKLAGINSLADLENASNEQLINLLKNIQAIRANAEAPLAAPTTVTTPKPTSSIPRAPSAPKGPSGPSPEDARKRALEQLRDETARLIKESLAYEKILERLTAKEISNTQAGKEILKLRKQIEGLLKTRNKLEDEYERLLAKGDKANKSRLGRVADLLDQNKKKLDELTESAKNGADAFKQIDLKGIIPFIKSANSLGVVSGVVGVDLAKVSDILIQGFLQGKLTLQELNEQLKKTQENLGKGIPNEVGAVTKAFQNLVDAGVKGGQFSVDAFSDIFSEFRERFKTEGSALREQQRRDLLAALETAKEAQKNAVGPEAAKSAKEALDAAKKALDDFYATVPAPDLADLRADLEKSFGVEQISKFFQAIDESGLRTFADLEKAGADGIIPILTRLTELGFKFNETSDEIKNIQIGLQDAEKAANGNKDPVQAALDLIKQFNAGAESLPPAFNSTTEAVGGLNSTLSQLSDGFDGIIEKLSLLSGQTYTNDVVFNVRTVGDSSSQALVEILFGDGSTVGGGTGNGGGGGGGGTSDVASKIAAKRKRLSELNRKGKSNSDEAKRLRQEIRQLSKEL